MYSLRSIEGDILAQGSTIPRAIYILDKGLRSKYKKLRVFQDNLYFCDYYL